MSSPSGIPILKNSAAELMPAANALSSSARASRCETGDGTSQDVILIGPLKSFATLLVSLSCDYIAVIEPTVVPFASPL